ncbi:MAG: ribose 5-phosphate isomerase B [Luteibaculaceae bacterium]|jgi:ribose 5-phosphate isomerase B
MSKGTFGIGCDHAGFELKTKVVELLNKEGYAVEDFGCNSEESVDYPDHAHPLAKAIIAGKVQKGIAICGSGNGINITMNKYAEIRSALCWTEELAQLARSHNNANVLAIPARFIAADLALNIVRTFINTDFEGGRHQRRIDKISGI